MCLVIYSQDRKTSEEFLHRKKAFLNRWILRVVLKKASFQVVHRSGTRVPEKVQVRVREAATFVKVRLHVQTMQREGNVGVDLGGEELVTKPLQVNTEHLNTT